MGNLPMDKQLMGSRPMGSQPMDNQPMGSLRMDKASSVLNQRIVQDYN